MHPLVAAAETVIFDLDGTLVHSHIDFSRLRAAARRLALEAGVPEEQLVERDAMSVFYTASEWLPETERGLFRARVFEEFEAIEKEYCYKAEARAGACAVVEALLEMDIAVGVATRNCARMAREMLRSAGIPLDCVVAREHVGRVKPDPEHIWTVVRELGMPRRNICMIGDHPTDALAGKRVKAKTVGVLPPGETESRFDPCPPDLIVRELSDLLAHR